MIVSFASLKGGTGKSTSCTNLAYALSRLKNKKILVVDFDIQSGATHILSSKFKKFKAGISDVIRGERDLQNAIHEYNDNLHLIPMKDDFFYLSCEDFTEQLKKALTLIKKDYDYIFFDLPPSMYPASGIPLTLSDIVIVPINCSDGLGVLGLQGLIKIIKKIGITPPLYIIATIVDKTKTSKEVINFIKQEYSEHFISASIRKSALISQACTLGLTIFEHRPKSIGAQDYQKMAGEFLKMVEKRSK